MMRPRTLHKMTRFVVFVLVSVLMISLEVAVADASGGLKERYNVQSSQNQRPLDNVVQPNKFRTGRDFERLRRTHFGSGESFSIEGTDVSEFFLGKFPEPSGSDQARRPSGFYSLPHEVNGGPHRQVPARSDNQHDIPNGISPSQGGVQKFPQNFSGIHRPGFNSSSNNLGSSIQNSSNGLNNQGIGGSKRQEGLNKPLQGKGELNRQTVTVFNNHKNAVSDSGASYQSNVGSNGYNDLGKPLPNNRRSNGQNIAESNKKTDAENSSQTSSGGSTNSKSETTNTQSGGGSTGTSNTGGDEIITNNLRTTQRAPMNVIFNENTLENTQIRECIRNRCPSTNEYNPVCGDDNITYTNANKLKCAQICNSSVKEQHRGACVTTQPPAN